MNKRLVKIEETISMLLLAAIVILVFAAAIMRTLGFPIIWSVETAQMFFIWVCMLGANQALRRNEHVGVDVLVRRFSERTQLKINFLLFLIVAVFLILLLVYGIQLSVLNPERILGTVELPYTLVTSAIPAGAALMLLTTAGKLITIVKQLKLKEVKQEQGQ